MSSRGKIDGGVIRYGSSGNRGKTVTLATRLDLEVGSSAAAIGGTMSSRRLTNRSSTDRTSSEPPNQAYGRDPLVRRSRLKGMVLPG